MSLSFTLEMFHRERELQIRQVAAVKFYFRVRSVNAILHYGESTEKSIDMKVVRKQALNLKKA